MPHGKPHPPKLNRVTGNPGPRKPPKLNRVTGDPGPRKPRGSKKNGTTNGNNTKNDNRTSELLAAASDAAGSMADRHKGGTHTPSGSGGVKSGASHNAKFLEVWHSGYKLDEPNM